MSNVRALVPLGAVLVEPLALHPGTLPELCRLFEAEWPSWYGPGGPGNAADDLSAYSSSTGLPFGVVALQGGDVCGVAALKAESIPSHRHLSPWAAAGFVKASLRGRGIGTALLVALEEQARIQGYCAIHCATATSESLLQRRGYRLLERVAQEGQDLGVYQRGL
jgi:GNAT superfamily N-acetyltransferase